MAITTVNRYTSCNTYNGRFPVRTVKLQMVRFGSVPPRPRCSGFNMQVNFVVYLCLTGVREVPEPSDTMAPMAVLVSDGVPCGP